MTVATEAETGTGTEGAPRTVGIIGGMGPAATIALQRLILEAVPASDDADHVPLLVDMNPQVPSRIARLLEGGTEDPEPVLVRMARRLERAGAEALAMPCNTAHHYARSIEAAVAVPLLDMISLAVEALCGRSAPGDRVGLLGSPAVARLGLFDEPLRGRGRVPLWPEDPAAPLAIIRRIKGSGPDEAAARALGDESRGLAERGARVQLLCCTEFSLLPADALAGDVVAIDALRVLAEAVVAFATRAR